MIRNDEERVLVLSTLPADSRAVCAVAGRAGISAQSCRNMDELCAGIREGAGAVVLSQKALGHAWFDQLAATIHAQPPWSDLPLIVVTVASGAMPSDEVLQVTPELGNVVVLQRPLRVVTLVTALRTALRARRRQHEVRRSQELLEEALSRERARASELEAIMEAAPVGITIAHDPDCRIITGNHMTYELLGLPQGSNLMDPALWAGRPPIRVMREGHEIPASELPVRKATATGQPVRNCELDLEFSDGRSLSVLGSAVPLIGDDGRPRGAVAAYIDITEHKHEVRFRQTLKLESVGLLAGGIAHDFNNLLTSIMGNASLMGDEVGPGPAMHLKEIIRGAEQAAHLTRQLLAYSGRGQVTVQDLNIPEAVDRIKEQVGFSMPEGVDLVVKAGERLPTVRMDPHQLEQILVNLVLNAAEAIGEDKPGKITIAVSLTNIERAFADARGEEVAAGQYASIEVSDTGSGIDEEAKSRIFDPFFTTHFAGRGLGLAAVAGILRSQKGGITLESAPGRGSSFRVLLPVAEAPAEQTECPPDAEGRVTILVVDTETALRDFISTVLRRQGYCTVMASDEREALAVCERESWKIDAAVLDLPAPLTGAHALMPALRARQPQAKLLFTGGYDEAQTGRLCSAYPGAAFRPKPYTAQQLLQALDELLGAKARHGSKSRTPSSGGL